MNDNEIIQALECFKSEDCLGEQCPHFEKEGLCGKPMCNDVYDFIYRQKAEIEKLNVELVGMRGACESYKIHYDNAQAEIERLRHILVSFMSEVENWEHKHGIDTSNIPKIAVLGTEKENCIKQAKSEAYREFAERFKNKNRKYWLLSAPALDEEIDNTLKELTEKNDKE